MSLKTAVHVESPQVTNLDMLREIDWRSLPWKAELQNNIKSLDELQQYIDVPQQEAKQLAQVIEQHPMNIPRYYLSLVDGNNPDDPIRKLCIPQAEELVVAGSMGQTTTDPYGDDKHDMGNGILHKYGYTALVVSTEYCSMYCRHCFRKRLVGLKNDKTVENFVAAAEYIAKHPEITNVVISGGDALMLPTSVLTPMLEALQDIPHINYVRIGSRAPVVNPTRLFDDDLIELMERFNQHKALYLPTHFNHPAEITPLVEEALARVRTAGVSVQNQAVLLKGINDDSDVLVELMNKLVRAGVNPYYLYQCMPVSRVRHHFQLSLKRGVDLVDTARRQLDGYAKRFRYIMGHDIGKIEICGRIEDKLILKQIHARSGEEHLASRMLVYKLNDTAGWLDGLEQVSL